MTGVNGQLRFIHNAKAVLPFSIRGGPIIGAALSSASLMTRDADFATAELAIAADDGKSTMLDILKRADPSFSPLPALKKSAPPSAFRNDSGFRVDLLTPIYRRSDTDPMPLANLQASATPLHYLDWLMHEAIPAVALAGSGISIRVPAPERFAVHKLILAHRRHAHDRLKRQKDLLQAKALMDALQVSDPEPLERALRSARGHGREGWADPIKLSLAELDAGAAR